MSDRKPKVISHRANCGAAPENSISGIRAAVELGVDKIELDVQRSLEGQLVLMHDLKVDRTTNGSGKVKNLGSSQIREFHLVSEKYPEEKIPLLEDVFAFVAPKKVDLLLEVKSPKEYPGIEHDLVQLIRAYSMEKRVEILSFDWNFLRQLKQTYSYLFTCALSSLPFEAKATDNFDALGIYYPGLLLRDYFGFSLPRAKNIYAGTPTSERAIRHLVRLGVDGIITDKPEVLMKILNS